MATRNQVDVGLSGSNGTGSFVGSTSASLTTPILGTPTSGNLINCTSLPISTGISNLGTNVATFLQTPSSANFLSSITNPVGTGSFVFSSNGTFTPALQFGGASVSLTYSSQVGFYTKMGNVIMFTLTIGLTNKGVSTGSATVTGLPVATRGSTNFNLFFITEGAVTYLGNYMVAYAGSTSTTINLAQVTTALGIANLADTNFANNSGFAITGSYLI